LQKADVIVLLSTYPEPFSRVWLEGMQHQLPLLVSKTLGAQEVLRDAAVYCNPFDQHSITSTLSELISHPEHRTAISSHARERVQHFAPAVVHPALLSFYKSL
jgi:glycosyltransferase involved in cell wall biosynthesis